MADKATVAMTLFSALKERHRSVRRALIVLLAVFLAAGAYLVWPGTIADNKDEQSSRKIVKCRVLAAHRLVTVLGCPRRSSAHGLSICGSSCE